MIEELLGERINDYAPTNALEQENVLQELMQHFVLAALSRAGLFSEAAFHGGTCLRILFGMNRFSEDLDFLLRQPTPDFAWAPYLEKTRRDCEEEGIVFEAQDRSDAGRAVRKAFLKTDSVGQLLTLTLPYSRNPRRKIKIKLEIDTNPPAGSHFQTGYITFPQTAAITTQTLESGFATKSHALLCREYTKGRDWYDFLWYISKATVPDFGLLGNALDQVGPWAGRKLRVTGGWYVDSVRQRIEEIDWDVARADVSRFVSAKEQQGLELWDSDLFMYHLNRLAENVSE